MNDLTKSKNKNSMPNKSGIPPFSWIVYQRSWNLSPPSPTHRYPIRNIYIVNLIRGSLLQGDNNSMGERSGLDSCFPLNLTKRLIVIHVIRYFGTMTSINLARKFNQTELFVST